MHVQASNSFILNIILLVAAFILFRQVMSMFTPIRGNGARFILALFFLILGAPLCLNPQAHPIGMEEILALLVGVVLSLPLILTTDFEVRDDGQIYAKRSMAFIISFVAVIVVRLALRSYLSDMESNTRMMLFFLVALGYVIPWRITSFFKFRKVLPYKNNSRGGGRGRGGKRPLIL